MFIENVFQNTLTTHLSTKTNFIEGSLLIICSLKNTVTTVTSQSLLTKDKCTRENISKKQPFYCI